MDKRLKKVEARSPPNTERPSTSRAKADPATTTASGECSTGQSTEYSQGENFVAAATMAITQLPQSELRELTRNLNKVLTPIEKPMCPKRTRAIILQTHRTKGASGLWALVCRQPLTISRFSAWKFCTLLHKILRDGHPQTLHDTQRQRSQLDALASYWARRTDDAVAQCIVRYCRVLLTHLHLHTTYASCFHNCVFAGKDAQLTASDVNVCFQLCTDIFDSMEAMLRLTEEVFDDIREQHINPASPAGLCRLMSLTTVADDCITLYSNAVSCMCVLCAQLPCVDVIGFQDRFQAIYARMQTFFLQLFGVPVLRDLCDVPQLPETAPNFYKQAQVQSAPTPSAPEPDDTA